MQIADRDAGTVAAEISDATLEYAYDFPERADSSHITDMGHEASFILTLPNGQRFRVSVQEVA